MFVVVVDGRSENARPAGLLSGLLGISHAGKVKEVLKCLPGKAFCRAVKTGGVTAIAVISVFISLFLQGCYNRIIKSTKNVPFFISLFWHGEGRRGRTVQTNRTNGTNRTGGRRIDCSRGGWEE